MPSSYRFYFVSLITLLVLGCKTDYPLDIVPDTDLAGFIVVTTLDTDPATGPGIVSLFTPDGKLVRPLEDLYATGSSFPAGSAFVPPESVIVSVEGVDSLHKINIKTKVIETIISSGLSATTVRQLARSELNGDIFVVEAHATTPQVEKFNAAGSRVGNPFINTTTGPCVLSGAYGIAHIPTHDYIAVVGTTGRLSVYDKDGGCVRQVTTSPFDTGSPSGIAFHKPSGRLIISRAGDSSIWSVNIDGTDPQMIFLNTGIINVPRAVTTDEYGNIYASSRGTDTVEKLTYSGTGMATRALSGPLLGPGFFSQNITSITVIPE